MLQTFRALEMVAAGMWYKFFGCWNVRPAHLKWLRRVCDTYSFRFWHGRGGYVIQNFRPFRNVAAGICVTNLHAPF